MDMDDAMNLRQSVLQDVVSLFGDDDAMKKLQKYIRRLKDKNMNSHLTEEDLLNAAPKEYVTQEELDARIQKSIQGPIATKEEVNTQFTQWRNAK